MENNRDKCIHCDQLGAHKPNCIVAIVAARNERDALRESAADRQQNPRETRFVNVATKVMQGDHCAAVACSSNMAKHIAIALNNRRDARTKTTERGN